MNELVEMIKWNGKMKINENKWKITKNMGEKNGRYMEKLAISSVKFLTKNGGKWRKAWENVGKNEQKCSKNDCFSIKAQVEMLTLMFYLQKSKIECVFLISDSF